VTVVVSTLPVVVERPRRFPEPVEAELARRRAHLLRRADGRVLDLDDPAARDELRRAIADPHVVPAYDTAVSVAQLLRFPDLVAAVRALDRLVDPDGSLLLVEPTGRPGAAAVVLHSLWARTRSLRGFHLGRDVTASLRCTAFVLDDLERFAMPTAVLSLRHAVEVHARRLARPAAEPLDPVAPVEAAR
jgi:hypothetical protein